MLDSEILTDNDFMNIIDKYLKDEKVQCLKNIPHHDSNRLNHCLKVSHLSYKICKKLNLNYESAAKAGLLHDFYYNRVNDYNYMNDKVKLFTDGHPEDAVKNAEKRFYLTNLEKDIIVSHMWPISTHIPRYKESFIVSISDKVFSVKEFGKKWNYSLSFRFGVYFLLFTNFLFK